MNFNLIYKLHLLNSSKPYKEKEKRIKKKTLMQMHKSYYKKQQKLHEK
jgi:hypothetical protein